MKVCPYCFNDYELKQFIISNSQEKGKCDCCKSSLESELIEINELLDFFAEFLEIFKFDSAGTTLNDLIQNDWNLFSDGSVCHNILSGILLILKSTFTDPLTKVNYIDEILECVIYWEKLKEELKWKKRFLTNIDKLEELGFHHFFKRELILTSSKPLYRARLHYSGDQNKFTNKDMYCPERGIVLAGRANPLGIPHLYLCKDIVTTLYEVRASYLDEVSIGKFLINKHAILTLVDFTESASAYLNIDEIVEYTKSMLLKRYISIDLSKPIRRYDSEVEYIPTQFICEFIKHYYPKADGILFSSSLHENGKNIVLFNTDKVRCTKVKKHKVTKVLIEENEI